MQETQRRGFIFGLIAVGVLAVAIGVAWAVSSNGPYYALPAWDQKLPAATRFVLLTDWNNEAVLDRETGLLWERSPVPTATLPWGEAAFACLNKKTGGRKGWRLPTIVELASLIDPSAGDVPLLPAGHPFLSILPQGHLSGPYWSATTIAASSDVAWSVSFVTGAVLRQQPKSNVLYAWCVRGGMQASEY